MLNEQTFVENFVLNHYDDLIAELKERKEKLTDKLIDKEEFKNWFNEDFAADRWIDFVSMTVNNMDEPEHTELLVDYGLNNVFRMCELIGVETYTTSKLTWHLIDHWYSYSFVVKKFKNMYEEKNPKVKLNLK